MKFFKKVIINQERLRANGLREFREKHNIGLRELSREANISPANISSIERGNTYTKDKTAMKLETAVIKLSENK
jgi:transcriptional regulator with XRE-family HTH domain